MCGIFGILDIKTDVSELRTQALELTKTLRHRGPDWSGIWNNDNTILCHERLAIVDVDTGAQPLISDNGHQALAVNGEIYNHKQLAKELDTPYNFKTRSDCEVILPLYQQRGVEFIDDLQGMFAFILYDEKEDAYLIARDHIGIIPLYTGYDEHGNFYVASEMKALAPVCKTISEFPPGHYMWSKTGEMVKYYKRDWMEYDAVKDNESNIEELRVAFEKAVKSHMMSDVPYAVLLSGGLDSSLVSAVAAKYVAKRVEDEDKSDAWWPRLHSFAVGLEGAPDLVAAQKVAEMIGTVHHEIHFTIQEGLDAIRDVIYHLETYDTTTIRAATPMYLMTRKIKAMGIKMVLSGEGSDEIFGGYLYFHKAPNAKEFHEETVRKLDRLHMFDCARANKATSAWGVEARVPFLDKEFMDVAMRLNPKDKMCGNGKMEKYILREAFDNGETLPPEVLWRQKEQFGDGVGYSWIDSIKDFVANEVSDQQLASAEFRFPINTPDTKEGYYYRTIFEGYFPQETAARCVPGGKSIACSTVEALEWDESFKNNADPSGRSMQGVHGKA
ncbi:MAG: asparagine synthase B [Pseudomonadota bacterium]|jgi:asparagine synthase (glutamine-hydrolysing)|uniref:asparagine synthase (glutamine-hydrolyzing) n=2 Tax=Alteromonas TaxID=226 RepID=A0A2S9V400_9ALTE|nr:MULTISPECIES: asparagine synthase B [Alteromonas]MAJ68793.1 asparagine synthase B [Alteromonadaceae bacterium]MBR9792916.1 asparagine synthase B [Gammaproteobacteria bacterium]MCP4865006.1 asparagine synthase B [Alteromonas sp.]MDG6096530.1 asparagine synthase B [Alteromonas sp. ZYF713]MDY6926158.1 asparagine synthase B [Pseudomonadota bacterium]RPH18966.1 MAG: asparagine synthase B [Alteromonadaceae bacterium TMED7]|tara:strand:+ start:2739 stop:4406 length:1668 start_codon:yes stop_codon:yes gene_type:complete